MYRRVVSRSDRELSLDLGRLTRVLLLFSAILTQDSGYSSTNSSRKSRVIQLWSLRDSTPNKRISTLSFQPSTPLYRKLHTPVQLLCQLPVDRRLGHGQDFPVRLKLSTSDIFHTAHERRELFLLYTVRTPAKGTQMRTHALHCGTLTKAHVGAGRTRQTF